MAVNEELAIIEPKDALALSRSPDLVIEEAHKAAVALKKIIESKPKKVTFNGTTYLQYEDWQTLGRFYGITAVARKTNFVTFGEGESQVSGWEAEADALMISTNQVISSADAMCLNDEDKWTGRPKYEWQNGVKNQVGFVKVPMFQLRSMAQTRACAKVLRNVLAWVVVLAGYSPTPAEEIDGSEEGTQEYVYDQRETVKAQPTVTTSTDTIAQFQKNAFLNACKKSGKKNDEVMAYYGSIGIESLDEMTKKDFQAALKWAMGTE